jgi:hypothetical protein
MAASRTQASARTATAHGRPVAVRSNRAERRGVPLTGDAGSRTAELLALQRTAGNAAVQSLVELQRQEAATPPKPPFTSGQTFTLTPPPITMSYGQLKAAGITPDKLPSPASSTGPGGSGGKADDESILNAENEVKAKSIETTVSATLPNPFVLTLPKIGLKLWPKIKPGIVFEREGDTTTKVAPQVEFVMLQKSLQVLGRTFDLEGGVTSKVGSPVEAGGGFHVDILKKQIIDPLDVTRKNTVTTFSVGLDLNVSQQTTVDPETKQAESKARGSLTVTF